jgi:nitrogen regulatory protein P-II 1
MKKIEAIIREEKLHAVIDALEQAGYPGVTVTDVRGHGKQRGSKANWHGQYQPHTFKTKTRLEIVVRDSDLNRILNTISETARSGNFGDGKIFVSEISDAIRIRTQQRGEIALD